MLIRGVAKKTVRKSHVRRMIVQLKVLVTLSTLTRIGKQQQVVPKSSCLRRPWRKLVKTKAIVCMERCMGAVMVPSLLKIVWMDMTILTTWANQDLRLSWVFYQTCASLDPRVILSNGSYQGLIVAHPCVAAIKFSKLKVVIYLSMIWRMQLFMHGIRPLYYSGYRVFRHVRSFLSASGAEGMKFLLFCCIPIMLCSTTHCS